MITSSLNDVTSPDFETRVIRGVIDFTYRGHEIWRDATGSINFADPSGVTYDTLDDTWDDVRKGIDEWWKLINGE